MMQMMMRETDRGKNHIQAVMGVLLQNRLRFIEILRHLQFGRIVSGEDAKRLRYLEHTLKGSPMRDARAHLMMLGQSNAGLLALLVAYAVYRVQNN